MIISDEYLLTFELTENKLEIHTNLSGLRNLVDELDKLLKSAQEGKNDHIHLMTEEWGGNELTSIPQSGEILNHVKICCWNEK